MNLLLKQLKGGEASRLVALNPEPFQSNPQRQILFDRYLKQAKMLKTEEGIVLVVPTGFQASALKKQQNLLEEALGAPVKSVEHNREIIPKKPHLRAIQTPPASARPEQTRLHFANGTLPRFPQQQESSTAKRLQKEAQSRQQAPELVSSPEFEMPQLLIERWVESVNRGERSQVLWLYGESGSGKSWQLKQINKLLTHKKRLVFVDVMSFFHEWRKALEAKNTMHFIKKYRSETDCFVLENLDELQGKVKTQEEVLFTVSALLERGASVAVSSFKSPQKMREVLDPSLFSRLLSGMTIEMPQPDRVFRERLWQLLIQQHALEHLTIDVRTQEALLDVKVKTARKAYTVFVNAIARLSLKSELGMGDIQSLESLHADQKSSLSHGESPKFIVEKVAELCGVSTAAIRGRVRRSDVSIARRFVCLALSRHLGLTNSSIAVYVEKDPSTIHHALKCIEEDIQHKRHVNKQWNWICTKLGFDNNL